MLVYRYSYALEYFKENLFCPVHIFHPRAPHFLELRLNDEHKHLGAFYEYSVYAAR